MKIQKLNIVHGDWTKLRDIKSIWFDLMIDKQITSDVYDKMIILDHRKQQDELQKYDYQRFN